MTMKTFLKSAVASTALLIASASPAGADEIRVLSAAAMQSVFKEIAGEFERASGHKLTIAAIKAKGMEPG
jgi:ABC-type molybdate transport system substrate-binding protein